MSMLVGEKLDCGIMLVNRWLKIGRKNIIHPMDKMVNWCIDVCWFALAIVWARRGG